MKITTKKNKLLKKRELIPRYEMKISEVIEKHASKEITDIRRDYFLRTYKEKIQDCRLEIEDGLIQVEHSIKCIEAQITNGSADELLTFERGPLTVFIAKNMPFWRAIFPKSKEFTKEINKSHSSNAFTINCANTKNASLIGTATDLLLGLMLGDSLIKTSLRSSTFGELGFLTGFIHSFFYRIKETISQTSRPSEWVHSKLIASFVIFLAKKDVTFRARNLEYQPDLRELKNLHPIASNIEDIQKAIFNITDMSMVEDIISLGDAIFSMLPKYKVAYYNPNFEEYGPISDSDCDLILDNTLYDLKCLSPKSKITENYIFQLIGYYILTRQKGYKQSIENVGFIFPRNNHIFQINANELAKRLGASSIHSVVEKFELAFQEEIKRNVRVNRVISLSNNERKRSIIT